MPVQWGWGLSRHSAECTGLGIDSWVRGAVRGKSRPDPRFGVTTGEPIIVKTRNSTVQGWGRKAGWWKCHEVHTGQFLGLGRNFSKCCGW